MPSARRDVVKCSCRQNSQDFDWPETYHNYPVSQRMISSQGKKSVRAYSQRLLRLHGARSRQKTQSYHLLSGRLSAAATRVSFENHNLAISVSQGGPLSTAVSRFDATRSIGSRLGWKRLVEIATDPRRRNLAENLINDRYARIFDNRRPTPSTAKSHRQ